MARHQENNHGEQVIHSSHEERQPSERRCVLPCSQRRGGQVRSLPQRWVVSGECHSRFPPPLLRGGFLGQQEAGLPPRRNYWSGQNLASGWCSCQAHLANDCRCWRPRWLLPWHHLWNRKVEENLTGTSFQLRRGGRWPRRCSDRRPEDILSITCTRARTHTQTYSFSKHCRIDTK